VKQQGRGSARRKAGVSCDVPRLRCPRCGQWVLTTGNLLSCFKGAPNGLLICGACSALLRFSLAELTESEWHTLTPDNLRAIKNARHMAREGRILNYSMLRAVRMRRKG
jgi:hypothetical protein